jgi:hypothetical protein
MTVTYSTLTAIRSKPAEACLTAANESLLHTSYPEGGGCIPGWTERVKPLRNDSIFWQNMWIDCGRPRSEYVADIMRHSRAAYHYAVREVQKQEDNIVRERLAYAMIDDSKRNFWLEVKKMRNCSSPINSSVDGFTEVGRISQLFAGKYRDLFTSVPYDRSERGDIYNEINTCCLSSVYSEECVVYASEVREAVGKLKPNKNDSSIGLSSNHVLRTGNDIMVHLACLFSSIIIYQ